MNKLQYVGYSAVGSLALAAQAFAAIEFGDERVAGGISGSGQTADVAIQTLVSRALMFLGILGVCYGIYGGFLIATAGGEEEKVKKGRTIIIQVLIGLVVIFLANSIIQWILDAILVSGA